MRIRFYGAVIALIVGTAANGWAQDEPKTATAVAVPSTPTAVATPQEGAEPKEVATVRPLSVLVEISGGTQLRGTLVDTSELPMRTSFGQAAIPLSEVAGIKLASEDNAITTVVLHNGDSITGATELTRLVVETEWGKADITGSSISSILFAQGMKWSSTTGANGQRWVLTAPAQTPAKSGVKPASATAPRSTGSRVIPASGSRTFSR